MPPENKPKAYINCMCNFKKLLSEPLPATGNVSITGRQKSRFKLTQAERTVVVFHSEFPNIYTAEAFARDNKAGQRLVAAIRHSPTAVDDNGKDGEGGSDELAKALGAVKSKRTPQRLQWLKMKLDLAAVPLPVKPTIRKPSLKPITVRTCRKCKVSGCTGFLN
jgi:hypothetical protein